MKTFHATARIGETREDWFSLVWLCFYLVLSQIYACEVYEINWPRSQCVLHSSVGRATHRQRGGHGFESRWSPDFFFRLLLSSCLNWKIYCHDHSSLSDLRIFTSLSAQNCDFKHPDKMIWDRIVFGTNSPKVRENPISKGFSLILDKAVDIAWSFRASQAQLSATAARQ